MAEEIKICKDVVKEYDIHNKSMCDHIIDQKDKEPWYKRLWFNIEMYFNLYIKDTWYNVKYFFKNFFLFRKVLSTWRPWDYNYQIKLFAFGLEQLEKSIANGYTDKETKNKKTAAIRELVKLLKTDYEDLVQDKVYGENGYISGSYHVTEYTDGSISFKDISSEEVLTEKRKKNEEYEKELKKARKKHYDQIFRIIRGQKEEDMDRLYKEAIDKLPEEERNDWNVLYKINEDIFDGTGIETWWD